MNKQVFETTIGNPELEPWWAYWMNGEFLIPLAVVLIGFAVVAFVMKRWPSRLKKLVWLIAYILSGFCILIGACYMTFWPSNGLWGLFLLVMGVAFWFFTRREIRKDKLAEEDRKFIVRQAYKKR